MPSLDAPRLSFELVDDDDGYPGFAVTACADGYAGATDIWISRADLKEFVSELDALDERIQGNARLRAGWVGAGETNETAQAELDLSIRPHGRTGRLEVSVTVRASAQWQFPNSAKITFELPEPNALTRFRSDMREICEKRGQFAVLTPTIGAPGV